MLVADRPLYNRSYPSQALHNDVAVSTAVEGRVFLRDENEALPDYRVSKNGTSAGRKVATLGTVRGLPSDGRHDGVILEYRPDGRPPTCIDHAESRDGFTLF